MPQNYVPIFIFALVAFLVAAGTVAICTFIRPRNPFKTKLMPYECGITPYDNARGRYTVRFYIVAILFVVFDVETIFLSPGRCNSSCSASSGCWRWASSSAS